MALAKVATVARAAFTCLLGCCKVCGHLCQLLFEMHPRRRWLTSSSSRTLQPPDFATSPGMQEKLQVELKLVCVCVCVIINEIDQYIK